MVNDAAAARPSAQQPPGDRVQVAWQAGDGEAGAHQAPPVRFRRTTAHDAGRDEQGTRPATGATQPG